MTEARVLCYSGIPSSHSPVASLHPTLCYHFNSSRSRHGPSICSSLRFNIPRTSNRSRHWLFLLASLARRRLGTGMCVREFYNDFVLVSQRTKHVVLQSDSVRRDWETCSSLRYMQTRLSFVNQPCLPHFVFLVCFIFALV